MRNLLKIGCFVSLALLGLSSPALGQVTINQSKANAGNVTPGDAAGFPVTLTAPGSYELTGNLTVPNANTTAIQVTADNVSINLNGFVIKGPTVCTKDALSGFVSCSPTGSGRGVDAVNRNGTVVVNGEVRGMGEDGLILGPNCRVERVSVFSNGRIGINTGSGSLVNSSLVNQNGIYGILVTGGTITGNTANENGDIGIFAAAAGSAVNASSLITDNRASGNVGSGIVIQGGTVTGNTARDNGGDGISTDGGLSDATVSGNTVVGNAGSGIRVGNGTVSGNTAIQNSNDGITMFGTGIVSGNTAINNTINGIFAGQAVVIGNTASGSENGSGINGSGAMFDNLVESNAGFGLALGAFSAYARNVVNNNNGSNANPQVSGGINLGQNMCGGDKVCP